MSVIFNEYKYLTYYYTYMYVYNINKSIKKFKYRFFIPDDSKTEKNVIQFN